MAKRRDLIRIDTTNTGDTALHNVTVTDDILGVVGSVASLAPGESVTMTKTMVAAVTSPTHNVGTSVGPDVLDKQVTASEPVPIVAAVVPAEVLGIQLTQPAVLPRTGFPVSGLSLFAAALIILGSTLRWNVNRRSKRTA